MSWVATGATVVSGIVGMASSKKAAKREARRQKRLTKQLNALEANRQAGGATALAQAALRSKKEVTASIEMQEAQNEKLRAQGEQSLQAAQMAEKVRVQGVAMSEAQRVQTAEASGKQFVWQNTENRETAKMDRVQSQIDGAQAAAAQHNADATAALTGTIGGVANVMGTVGAANIKSGGTFFKAGD